MEVALTNQARFLMLIGLCGLLWALAAIVVLGIPLWVVIAYLIFSGLNAELEHANIKLSYGLDEFDIEERQTVGSHLKMPFMNYNRL